MVEEEKLLLTLLPGMTCSVLEMTRSRGGGLVISSEGRRGRAISAFCFLLFLLFFPAKCDSRGGACAQLLQMARMAASGVVQHWLWNSSTLMIEQREGGGKNNEHVRFTVISAKTTEDFSACP